MTRRQLNALKREKTQESLAELLEIMDRANFSRTDWLTVIKIASKKPLK